jgi:glycosyltransferase involved in cell wall biosynthesis
MFGLIHFFKISPKKSHPVIRTRLYYKFKPYLPWRVRIFIRRLLARKTQRASAAVWPICESAGRRPDDWPGWPDGKQFAFVLTHDVESLAGLAKTRQLKQLDQDLGFRSSFNFIPEGEYRASRELREELAADGFEIGVHDLHHDGMLYSGRNEFADKAAHINRYLKEWEVGGFRSGFMHHALDWAHELNINYDASTFDTDPFEPQPDGVHTIFPFWVASPESRGYVELPYTLPQDFTLFVLLKEEGPEIWQRKLAWLAKNGGMALLDAHPDYMDFSGHKAKASEYPVAWYRDFLQHVKERYAGKYWNPLPRELADWYRAARQKSSHAAAPVSTLQPSESRNGSAKPRAVSAAQQLRQSPPKRVCMIVHSIYECDNRVIRYANALAERGDEVDVVALKRNKNLASVETIGKVRVRRLQGRRRKDQQGRGAYLFPLLRFWLAANLWLSWKHLRHRYDAVHVHNVPDFLVFTAWLPKLTGAKIILDIHDLVPEFYASKFRVPDTAPAVKMLARVERASAGFSDHVIISNHLWHKLFVQRSVHEGKCSVFINRVDSKVFYRRDRLRNDGRLIIMFPGGLQWHQGLDIAIRAFAQLPEKLPTAEFHIYGDGNMKDELLALARELRLTDKVRFFDPLPAVQIAQVMSDADLGVVPKRADSFGNEAYSTKIMEFMSVGVPVIVSKTTIDQYYFNDSVVRFFESGNVDALAAAMIEVLTNPSLRQNMVARASEYAVQNSWEVRKADYLQLVDSLCSSLS